MPLQVLKQTILRHKLLLTRSHILYLYLRPLISVKKRDARAQVFSRLELPGYFGWRERVIDAVAAVAQLLNLCERVGPAFFLCDDDVDVDFLVVRDGLLHCFASMWCFID